MRQRSMCRKITLSRVEFCLLTGPQACKVYREIIVFQTHKWAWAFLYAVFCDVRLFVSKRMLLWKPLNPSYTAVVQQTSKLGG